MSQLRLCAHPSPPGLVAGTQVDALTSDPGTEDGVYLPRLIALARSQGLLPEINAPPSPSAVGDDINTLRPVDRGGWLVAAASPFAWTTCPQNQEPKPPRSHYCRATNRLVLEMDHYCVWIWNTVGYGNFAAFYRTLCYMFVGCVFGLREAHVAREMLRPEPSLGLIEASELWEEAETPLWMVCCVLTICVCVVGPFLGWHTYLSATAQTSIEYAGSAVRRTAAGDAADVASPYCRGSYWANWNARVCGGRVLTGLLAPGVPPVWPPTGCLGEMKKDKAT